MHVMYIYAFPLDTYAERNSNIFYHVLFLLGIISNNSYDLQKLVSFQSYKSKSENIQNSEYSKCRIYQEVYLVKIMIDCNL